MPPTSDRLLLLSAFALAVSIYIVLQKLNPQSQVPLLVAVFVGTNMISRTQIFQNSVRRAAQRRLLWLAPKTGNDLGNSKFQELAEPSRTELLSAIRSLANYASNSRASNERRRKLYRMMSWRQQKLCDDAGYSQKLRKIDLFVDKNQDFLGGVVEAAKAEYGLSYRDAAQLKDVLNTSSSNYRVVEALGHFVRDWTTTDEIAPLLSYITAQLDTVIPQEEAANTVVVFPGSGLGRLAHEVAKHRDYGAVHAIEFSGLMHTCHQYMYTAEEKTIYPYVHTCSNFVHTLSQFRGVPILGAEKPGNLTLSLDDFRYFSVPDREKYSNVVVVSAFFVDTAENLIDYFDVINQLTAPSSRSPVQNGYWINVGPLKYGSAAQVELNADEIAHIRRKTGWKDIHSINTIEKPINGQDTVGYITDKESLWQGFYGLAMWTSAQAGNKRKVKDDI